MALDEPYHLYAHPASLSNHTMGANLTHYVLPKVNMALRPRDNVTIDTTHLTSEMSTSKLRGKPFNWRRPVFRRSGAEVTCFLVPGCDYVYHYSRLISTAASILQVPIRLKANIPSQQAMRKFMSETLPELPKSDAIVLGYVHKLFVPTKWQGSGTWRYATVNIGTCKILLLGCEFSYWGNMAGALIDEIAARRVSEWVIYLGKLGGMQDSMEPNTLLATGNQSTVLGQNIRWDTRLMDVALASGAMYSRHVTVPSVLDETIEWVANARRYFDVVDPEIGHMGISASRNSILFDYLHLVTDNLVLNHHHGLHNERDDAIVDARDELIKASEAILIRAIIST
jgi:hypothetical protein